MQRLSGLADTRQFATAVRAAADDASVREIILDVDSPGGEVAEVATALRQSILDFAGTL